MDAWRKRQENAILTPLETIAADWMFEHPEYHTLLADPDATMADFSVDRGETNPFLHLSMHVSIAEQISIDQPPGIRGAFEALAAQKQSIHEAAHEVMECLGQMLWEAQRNQTPPDGTRYVECVRQRLRSR